MKTFKAFYINPLKKLQDLPIKPEDYDFFELSTILPQVPPEAREDLANKLLKIVSDSKGAFVVAGNEEEEFVSVNVSSSSNRKKRLSFPEPNPIHLYLSIAVKHLYASIELKKDLTTLEVLDANGFEKFCAFSEEIMEGVIFLVMAAEAFMNYMVDDGKTYAMNGKTMGKKDIEWLDFSGKIRDAMPVITGIDFFATNPIEYNRMTNLVDLRNELVHLKKLQADNYTFYEDLYKRLIDISPFASWDAVLTFINTLQPEFVQLFDPPSAG
jgi:hypothetical protein